MLLEQALALLPFLYLVHVFPNIAYSGHSLVWFFLAKIAHFPTDHHVRKLSISGVCLGNICYVGCKTPGKALLSQGSSPTYLQGGREQVGRFPEELRCSFVILGKEVPVGSTKSLITPKMPSNYSKQYTQSACKGILKAGPRTMTCLGHSLQPGFLDRKPQFPGMCPLSYLVDSLPHEVFLHGNI